MLYGAEGEINHPQHGPAPESALGLRPRMALSSAQVSRSVSELRNPPLKLAEALKNNLDREQRFHVWGRLAASVDFQIRLCHLGW